MQLTAPGENSRDSLAWDASHRTDRVFALREVITQVVATTLGVLVVLVALLQGIGCGGGINSRPPAPSNPGSYNLSVVGTDCNGTQTSAIIPINVIQ